MKKTVSLLLVVAFIMSFSVLSFADGAPVKVASTCREGVEIPAFITIPADYDAATPANLVMMIHGHGGNHNEWGGYDKISDGLAANGVIVATLDFPGCGDSAESFQLNTMTNMKNDVLDVINYVKGEYNVAEVGAFGYSMGGRIALEMTVEDMFAFDSIEFVAPAEDYEDLKNLFGGHDAWDELYAKAAENGFVNFTTVYGQEQELSKEWFEDLAKYPDGLAEAAAAKFDKPVMVIYAVDDEAVSPAVSQGVADAFGAPVYTSPFGGHSYSFYNDAPEIAAVVNDNSIAFFSGAAEVAAAA